MSSEIVFGIFFESSPIFFESSPIIFERLEEYLWMGKFFVHFYIFAIAKISIISIEAKLQLSA
jgi:hypothetical protein